jgi:hypothetical protein
MHIKYPDLNLEKAVLVFGSTANAKPTDLAAVEGSASFTCEEKH